MFGPRPTTVVVGPEDPEPLVDGCIDLGEIVAQSLALGVSSWPRRADAPDHFEAGDTGQDPFAKLGSLKATDKNPAARPEDQPWKVFPH